MFLGQCHKCQYIVAYYYSSSSNIIVIVFIVPHSSNRTFAAFSNKSIYLRIKDSILYFKSDFLYLV